eukprot:CAMPEP_0171172660 /NCGR_PEP_ID=MMETSP0790-20130122/9830_1 /TAXON_ID=2925 /ORGANISM="Alexandrium catenella, Strain OF101" /LENGTH=724 /DNA_ID=CAMNT_0011637517 /DNA_START=61 /DNA_END=2233 /DNA_ORIENTATION=+
MARSLRAIAAVALSSALGAAAEPRSWEQAIAKANEVMPRISWKERRAFLHGITVGEENHKFGTELNVPSHSGYTRRVKDLHVPGLKFEEGASGYKTLNNVVGTSTCFPSLLALASTWDTQLAKAFGTAIGAEFKGKGASVLLGPTLNVHHTPNDGRNVLSLSGEDPVLGASLAGEYISGVHSQGVIASPKSLAFFETVLPNGNVAVEDSTAWQLYYPPFEAAVQAGAVAMTCPSTMVNGEPACGSKKLLLGDLREKMGFKGFVTSDLGATVPNGMSLGGLQMIENGLDLEMPVEAVLGRVGLLFHGQGNGATQTTYDTALVHMLSAVFKLGLDTDEGCAGPHQCFEALHADVTSPEHTSVARSVATEAVTLLKNKGVLPLEPSSVKKIAIVGPAAGQVQDVSPEGEEAADYYSAAGGSEHCRTGAVVTPLAALSRYASKLGIEVESTTSRDLNDVRYTIHSVDVAIVVVAATSRADAPRMTLALDSGADELIREVAKVKKTVVLMQTPGAVLTPWRDQVSAIANLFLAGQETGNAWAAVVFGEAEPAGRLPVVFPAVQTRLFAGADPTGVRYDEGLFTSYRAADQQAAFPFGHGLTYTDFSYGSPELKAACGAKVCVSLRVTNAGNRSGREVAQAYLEFPAETRMPRKLLRGFRKTRSLQPGETEELTFAFSERDVSIYSDGKWLQPAGGVIARFGASSEDLRQQLALLPLAQRGTDAAPAAAA